MVKVRKFTFLVEVEDHYHSRSTENMRRSLEKAIDRGAHELSLSIENLSVKNYNRLKETKGVGVSNARDIKHPPERSINDRSGSGC